MYYKCKEKLGRKVTSHIMINIFISRAIKSQ